MTVENIRRAIRVICEEENSTTYVEVKVEHLEMLEDFISALRSTEKNYETQLKAAKRLNDNKDRFIAHLKEKVELLSEIAEVSRKKRVLDEVA